MANPVLAKVIVRLYCFIQSILIGFNKHIAYLDIFAVMIHRLGNTEHSGANMLPSYGLVIGNLILFLKFYKNLHVKKSKKHIYLSQNSTSFWLPVLFIPKTIIQKNIVRSK